MNKPVSQTTLAAYRDFVVEYPFAGTQWGLMLRATSQEDAEARLRAIGAWGSVKGEVHETIHVPIGAGWLGRLLADARVWWLNRRKT